jgi:aspartyl-tRNA(Asn)/glutamyl-tRNA(Gln) amidotransferase subunit A
VLQQAAESLEILCVAPAAVNLHHRVITSIASLTNPSQESRPTMRTLATLASELSTGATTSRALVEECLQRIADPRGEGDRVFIRVYAAAARVEADRQDIARRGGTPASALAGIPVSVKDLFDVEGDVTAAGSRVLRDQAPARSDAVVVARLRAAGCVVLGRTNMTEFAYSGLGLNPHYGTPVNPFDRQLRRIPGGSSSGAAVSVTDGMACGAVGTDTGGSCRIPAAFCGIVGFKPTARRVPQAGTFPLSATLDSIGPLAPTIHCCAALDAVLAGEAQRPLETLPLAGLRFAVPQSYVMNDLDTHVRGDFARACTQLSQAGASLSDIALAELEALPHINRKGGFAAAEAYRLHGERLEARVAEYDPRVAKRILRGREQDDADYQELKQARADLIRRVDQQLASFDAVLMPTTPIIAPTFAELESDEAYGRVNLLVLRNPSIANFLDRCAVSIPCHRAGAAPSGLMLMGAHGADRRLLAIAAAAEAHVSPGVAER